MPCKGVLEGDRLVFTGKSEKDFLKELTRGLVKRGQLVGDHQGRGASRWTGTHEGRKGQYRACGDPVPGSKSRLPDVETHPDMGPWAVSGIPIQKL